MKNMNLVRGVFLMAISLLFGLASFNYRIGQFSKSGPGLFPLLVSAMLFLVGLLMVVRSYYVAPVPLSYNVKNIAIILAGLCGFSLLSQYVNMIAGILFLVFCTGFAGRSYSISRNLKISAGLLAVAVVFKTLLGLNFPCSNGHPAQPRVWF